MEKEVWKAEILERGVSSTLVENSQKGIELAISAYEEVVKEDPLKELSTKDCDPLVMSDIRRILINSKIALAKLYFLGDRLFFAGELYQEDDDSPLMNRPRDAFKFNLELFTFGKDSRLEFQCENIFKSLMEEERIWKGDIKLEGSFIEIPLVLAKIYKMCGQSEKYSKYCKMAESSYKNIIVHWPDSPIAEKARNERLNLHILRQDWQRALIDIDDLLKASARGEKAPDLKLKRGRIILGPGDDYGRANNIFQKIILQYPHSKIGYEARLPMAWIYLKTNKRKEAMDMLEKVERSEMAREELRARASLWIAMELEKGGEWAEARQRLKRILRVFPKSSSALDAAFLLISHNVRLKDKTAARRDLIKARDFYLSIIYKENVTPGRRLAAENYLVESYLLLGDCAEVASLLAVEWERIPWPGDAGALLRSAVLFLKETSDRSKAGELLKKCIALYPKTMYARRAGEMLMAIGMD